MNWIPRETGWRSLKVSWADGRPPSVFLQLTVCVSLLQISPFTPSSAAAAVLSRPGMMWDESRTPLEWSRWWRDVHPAGRSCHAARLLHTPAWNYEIWVIKIIYTGLSCFSTEISKHPENKMYLIEKQNDTRTDVLFSEKFGEVYA